MPPRCPTGPRISAESAPIGESVSQLNRNVDSLLGRHRNSLLGPSLPTRVGIANGADGFCGDCRGE